MAIKVTTVDDPPPLLHTVRSAQRELGLSRATIYRLLESGALESIRIGSARRIPHDALVGYVEQLRRSAA
ncbi:excisionase family DNA-binding protein [Frankia sp. Cr1]|uniref:excisionase family DNA-binding protein n=1 Tax=Frankia sp. Cr1 TaxID=3073931 RepID=UPI002AD35001|nr:excisionase family DNA-binding protein [Frankia sp. Cr1]